MNSHGMQTLLSPAIRRPELAAWANRIKFIAARLGTEQDDLLEIVSQCGGKARAIALYHFLNGYRTHAFSLLVQSISPGWCYFVSYSIEEG